MCGLAESRAVQGQWGLTRHDSSSQSLCLTLSDIPWRCYSLFVCLLYFLSSFYFWSLRQLFVCEWRDSRGECYSALFVNQTNQTGDERCTESTRPTIRPVLAYSCRILHQTRCIVGSIFNSKIIHPVLAWYCVKGRRRRRISL